MREGVHNYFFGYNRKFADEWERIFGNASKIEGAVQKDVRPLPAGEDNEETTGRVHAWSNVQEVTCEESAKASRKKAREVK